MELKTIDRLGEHKTAGGMEAWATGAVSLETMRSIPVTPMALDTMVRKAAHFQSKKSLSSKYILIFFLISAFQRCRLAWCLYSKQGCVFFRERNLYYCNYLLFIYTLYVQLL